MVADWTRGICKYQCLVVPHALTSLSGFVFGPSGLVGCGRAEVLGLGLQLWGRSSLRPVGCLAVGGGLGLVQSIMSPTKGSYKTDKGMTRTGVRVQSGANARNS